MSVMQVMEEYGKRKEEIHEAYVEDMNGLKRNLAGEVSQADLLALNSEYEIKMLKLDTWLSGELKDIREE